MIRILLADDHQIVRSGLRQLLDLQPDLTVVAEASDGEEVFELLDAHTVDVLVLDLSLPKLSGMEVVRRLQSEGRKVITVVLTLYPEDQLALHLLKAGAAAYLSKDRSPTELMTAIRQVARGRRYLTETLADLVITAGPVDEKAPHERLSAREREVFLLLTDGKTVSEISHVLDVSRSTASNHVAAIREKLGVASIGEIIRYAHRMGLLR